MKECDEIETNVKNFLEKLNCFRRCIASWNVLNMFRLVTKWQEIQKSKLLNAKNKKHRIFQDTKFYHPAKFELKWTKKGKVVPRMHLFVSYVPTMFTFHMFEHFNFWWIFKYSWTISKWQPRMTSFSRSLRELVANNSPTMRALFWVEVLLI